MISDKTLGRKRKIIASTFFIVFLSLFLFYQWQLITSSGYLFLGDKNYENKNYNRSLKNYKYVSAIGGNRDTIYSAKLKSSEIFYSHGLLDEAERELKEAIREVKNDFRAYEAMGDVCYAKRNIFDSIDYYKKALKLKDEERINIKLAKSFIANKDIDKANDIFLKLYLKNEHNDEVLYCLGLLSFYRNESFNNYFQEVEESDNTNYKTKVDKIKEYLDNHSSVENEVYSNVLVANLYNMINEPYLAIGKSKLVVEGNPDYRDVFIVLGKSNFIIGDYKRSYENFNKAFELDSHNPEINFWLGSVYQKLGNDLKAKEFMDRYRKLEVRG